MKLATAKERETAIHILTKSFCDNPTLLFLIRSKKKKTNYIKKIAEYAFDFAFRRNGVFLSDSENGVAICFKYNFMKRDIIDFFLLIRMVISAFALCRIIKIMKHSTYIEKVRPANGEYMYFWFFGVKPEEQPKVSARELAVTIITMAKRKQLDLYAETTLPQNKLVYERFGFEVYRHWYNKTNGINVWFMRKSSLQL